MTKVLLGGLCVVAAGMAAAGQGAAPLDWQVHDTEHFEVAYARTLEVDVEVWGREFERAYEQVSADLGYELRFTPMVVLFGTRQERDRIMTAGLMLPAREHILVPLDPPQEQVTTAFLHDLTHTFQFEMLPRQVLNDLPLWFTEGLAEHERGAWDAADLMVLHDFVRAGSLPRVSALAPLGVPEDPALSRSLGHAVFDFVAARWGKTGLRAFLFSLRDRPVTLQTLYEKAFNVGPAEFDRAFEAYLKERFR